MAKANKIYNEIIIDMNPESSTFGEVTYEDSYYSANEPSIQAGGGGMGGATTCEDEGAVTCDDTSCGACLDVDWDASTMDGNNCQLSECDTTTTLGDLSDPYVCSSLEDQAYTCCLHSKYLDLRDNSGNQKLLTQPDGSGNCCSGYQLKSDGSNSDGCIEAETKLFFNHEYYSSLPDAHLIGECCVPNSVTQVSFLNVQDLDNTLDGDSEYGYWNGTMPFCTHNNGSICQKTLSDEGGLSGQLEEWGLTGVNLGANNFDSNDVVNTWLCNLTYGKDLNIDGAMTYTETNVYGCEYRNKGNDAFTNGLQCSCQQYGHPESNCTAFVAGQDNSLCPENNPCGSGLSYCDSSQKFTSLYPCGGQETCTCDVIDACGTCGGDGLGGGEYCDCLQNVLDEGCAHCGGSSYVLSAEDQSALLKPWEEGGGAGIYNFNEGIDTPIGNSEDWYCDCGTAIYDNNGDYDKEATAATATQQTTIDCYNPDSLEESPMVTLSVCPGQNCEMWGYISETNVANAWDAGCMIVDACNYNINYELDCNECNPLTGNFRGGAPGPCLDNPDESCCVWPSEYCRSDGSSYTDFPYAANVMDDGYCDVDNSGNAITFTACPRCDEYDNPIAQCQEFGYNHPIGVSTVDGNIIGEGGSVLQMASADKLESNPFCNSDCYMNVGDGLFGSGEVSELFLDTCCGSNCQPYAGIQGDDWGNCFTATGCTDPAALNFGDGDNQSIPLYWDPGFPNSMFGQAPVQTCEYCPSVGDANCPDGYEFHFTSNYSTYGVTNFGQVTAGPGWTGGNFHLDNQSDILDSQCGDYQCGACFCKTDLNFLQELKNMVPSLAGDGLHVLQLFSQYGSLVFNSMGRLSEIRAGGHNCNLDTNSWEECKIYYGTIPTPDQSDIDNRNNVHPIPESIGNLTALEVFDMSYNGLTGDIPISIQNLSSTLNEVNLSYNNLTLLSADIHATYGNRVGGFDNIDNWEGICRLVYENGHPGSTFPYWFKIIGNNICPEMESQYSGTTKYPDCLAPMKPSDAWYNLSYEEATWIWNELGFIELNFNEYSSFNTNAQNIVNSDGTLNCTIVGCTDPQATNYWPEASSACTNCCEYDRFLHFPWGYSPLCGYGYGMGMDLFDMVQALHANVYGFKYNYWGDLDVTGYPQYYVGDCDYELFLAQNGYLPPSTVNNCSVTFGNSPDGGGSLNEYIDGNDIIDHWDGMWLRDSGYVGDGTCKTSITDLGQGYDCFGDARPLEFIQRINCESFYDNDAAGFRSQWFNVYFPGFGADLSMQGIEWFEDYDVNGDSDLVNDIPYWLGIGRIDIALQIQNFVNGIEPYPQNAPEEVELWEQAAPMVSMSYSQRFISETDAGFSLYSNANAPGILHRSGQWQCDDGGDSSVCYEDIYACGRAPEWIEDCTPCGSAGTCVPLTVDRAAEGHEKISKTKNKQLNYFSSNTPHISGSTLYTASMNTTNHPYFYTVLDGDSKSPSSHPQFDVTWGHYAGSGSYVHGNMIGTSEAVYKQYSSLLLDDNKIEKGFLISSGSEVSRDELDGDKDEWIYVINFKRKLYVDRLQEGNWTLILSGSNGGSGKTLHLTDDSKTTRFPADDNEARGARYNIISGSGGVPDGSSFSEYYNRYGYFYPDMGIMVFGEKLSDVFKTTTSPHVGEFNSGSEGNNQLYPLTSSIADSKNALRLVNCMRNVSGNSLTIYGEKETTDVIYVIRIGGDSFNFTNNFSILSGSGRIMNSTDTGVMNSFNTALTSSAFTSSTYTTSSRIYTGGPGVSEDGTMETISVLDDGETKFIWPGSNVSTMHGNPTTFITAIELFDQHGECVAIARTSKPIKKAFDREVVIKVKLSY